MDKFRKLYLEQKERQQLSDPAAHQIGIGHATVASPLDNASKYNKQRRTTSRTMNRHTPTIVSTLYATLNASASEVSGCDAPAFHTVPSTVVTMVKPRQARTTHCSKGCQTKANTRTPRTGPPHAVPHAIEEPASIQPGRRRMHVRMQLVSLPLPPPHAIQPATGVSIMSNATLPTSIQRYNPPRKVRRTCKESIHPITPEQFHKLVSVSNDDITSEIHPQFGNSLVEIGRASCRERVSSPV